ncbi:MAG: PhzF family phenazine biosynthesis protein [Haloarculaceae archaeon]
MDTRDVVVADAFAAEPTGGHPIGVLPGGADLTDDQLRAVARELDVAATAVPTDGPPDRLRAVGPGGPVDHHPQVTVGALALAAERGWIDAESASPVTTQGHQEVTVGNDGRAWVALEGPNPQSVDVGYGATADALGIDRAAFEDVGADLPPFCVSVGVEALAVPVNFLEHLGGASADAGALRDLTGAVGVDAVCAFTFDALAAESACHARTFAPERYGGAVGPSHWVRTAGTEVPVTPAVAGGIATHLYREGVIEDDEPVVEQGHYLDRPGRVYADVAGGVRVGGRAVASLDGVVAVPPPEVDDIVEI